MPAMALVTQQLAIYPWAEKTAMTGDPMTIVGGCQVRGQVGIVDGIDINIFLNIRWFGKFYWIDKQNFLQLMSFVKKFYEIYMSPARYLECKDLTWTWPKDCSQINFEETQMKQSYKGTEGELVAQLNSNK